MPTSRFDIIPIILTGTGVFALWGLTWWVSETLGSLQWSFYAAGLLALSGVFWFRRTLSVAEISIRHARENIKSREDVLTEEKKEFDRVKKELELELHKRSIELQAKQKDLAQKWVSYHEWAEFPDDGSDSLPPDDHDSEWQQKDQKVIEQIELETEKLFDKIKNNHYYQNGAFQRHLLSQDILDLMESVAKVYNPESEHPLLETSIEKLLRAINRITLQMLVLLEQLPLNIKEYNLKTAYETVRSGVKAYGAYKSASAYFPYVRPIYYLGRFTLGSNPITLGVGWAAGELISIGAKKISAHFANQYALNLLYDMVHIIGNESACIFGGDYRHREPYWIYGAELTELIRQFPLSGKTLGEGLKEIGSLSLRSEYDRIFLYRCLAAHTSAKPERFDATSFMTIQQRQSIVKRLEKFFKEHIHGNPKTLEEWKRDVEERMAIKLCVDVGPISKLKSDAVSQCLVSLASFLIEIKMVSPDSVPDLLSSVQLARLLDEPSRTELFDRIQNELPMVFDYPNIEPNDPLLDTYFQDIVQLTVRVFPHAFQAYRIVEETAHYFRRKDMAGIQKLLDRTCVEFIAAQMLPESPEKKPRPHICRQIMAHIEWGESFRFLYKQIHVSPFSFSKHTEIWLAGTDQRVMIISVDTSVKEWTLSSECLWCAIKTDAIFMERIRNRLGDTCRVSGGTWLYEPAARSAEAPTFVMEKPAITRYEPYFQAFSGFFKSVPSDPHSTGETR